MNAMERFEFDQQIFRLTCFKKKIDPEQANAYWQAFRGWNVSDFEQCVTRCLQEEKNFPTVPRLRAKLPKKHVRKDVTDIEDLPAMISCKCGRCDIIASVSRDILLNDEAYFCCAGTGISNCGGRWKGSKIRSKWYEAQARSEDIVALW